MKPPVPYYGSKQSIADRIVAEFPDHGHYVEPYCGSLAVLLAKSPSAHETVNDLDESLVTFWRVLRDRPGDLLAACELTPHSRVEHQAAYDLSGDLDEIEVARRVWVQLTSAEYDIEAIAAAVLDTDDRGRWGMSDDYVDADGYGDAEAFWAVVEHHAR